MFYLLKSVKDDPRLKEITKDAIVIDFDTATDDDVKNIINKYSFLLYHHSCTAAMGKVVDERLNVYEIQNLRVIDASIMPIVSRSNSNSPS